MSSISNIHSPILASRQATGRLQISNLSAEVTRCALVSYFGQLGELVDVRLAPAGTALVTYSDVETAQAVVDMPLPDGHVIEGSPALVEMATCYAVAEATHSNSELFGGSSPSSEDETAAAPASTFSGTNFSSRSGPGMLSMPTPDLDPENYVEENAKLFITQIPQHVAKADLLHYFKQFGKVQDIYMPEADKWAQQDWGYGCAKAQHKGIAFLTFRNKSLGDIVLQRAEYEVVPGVTVVVDKAKTRKDCFRSKATQSKSKKNRNNARRAAANAAPY